MNGPGKKRQERGTPATRRVITSVTHAVNTSLQQMHHVDYQTKRYIYMYEHV